MPVETHPQHQPTITWLNTNPIVFEFNFKVFKANILVDYALIAVYKSKGMPKNRIVKTKVLYDYNTRSYTNSMLAIANDSIKQTRL